MVIFYEFIVWNVFVMFIEVCEDVVFEISYVNGGMIILFMVDFWNSFGVGIYFLVLLFDFVLGMKLWFYVILWLVLWGIEFLCYLFLVVYC